MQPVKRLKYNVDPRFRRSISPGLPTMNMTRATERPSDVDAGSTLQRKHSMPIKATRYFTDVNGTILAKTDAGLVAAGMATAYPLFILGEFDRQGGYRTGLANLSPQAVPGFTPPVIYTTFVNGVTGTSNNVVTPFSPANTIQPLLKQGDLVAVYTDNLLAPNYFCFMVQTNDYAALSSILDNLKTTQADRRLGQLFAYELNWFAPEAQWDQTIFFIQSDNLGTWKADGVQPFTFKTPYNVLEGFITVKTAFLVNQFMELAVTYELATDVMSFNFNMEKIS